MLLSPRSFQTKVSRCFIHLALVNPYRHRGEMSVAQRRTTMTPPAPYPSRDVGDPLVTVETRCVRRPSVRRVPLPGGWLWWECYTDSRSGVQHQIQASIPFAPAGPNLTAMTRVLAISLGHRHPS